MPRKAVESSVKRVPLNMKTTETVREMLEEAARQSGRSLTAETEHRLMMSFEWERAFRDAESYREDFKRALVANHRGQAPSPQPAGLEAAIERAVAAALRKVLPQILAGDEPEDVSRRVSPRVSRGARIRPPRRLAH